VDMSGNYTRVLSIVDGSYFMSVESTARFLGQSPAPQITLQKPLYNSFTAIDYAGK
jgi:hypothetical protein